ncbi:MAG: hypothetical protein EBS53_12315 [Bacteroidetes bacterium]|nr:hypothetical protein [Bacteroidota bacterium]
MGGAGKSSIPSAVGVGEQPAFGGFGVLAGRLDACPEDAFTPGGHPSHRHAGSFAGLAAAREDLESAGPLDLQQLPMAFPLLSAGSLPRAKARARSRHASFIRDLHSFFGKCAASFLVFLPMAGGAQPEVDPIQIS